MARKGRYKMDFENKEKDMSWEEAEQKLKKAFDFAAFLGTEELDDKVTDVMDGKDLLEPDAFDRFAPDYVPRRGIDPERGRHEAPGQEPVDFVEETPAEPVMDPNDPRYAAPERPRVLVAGQQRPTVYVTPEGDFDGPDNYGGGDEPPAGNGEGKKWLVAIVITLGVVALVLGGVLALFSGGSPSGERPATERDILIVTPAPTDKPADEPAVEEEETTPTPAPTDAPTVTPAPTEAPVETYTILVTAGTGGSITPSGTVEIQEGEDVTFTIRPDDGYDISQLIIDGDAVVPAGSYTFADVTDDHTIYAVFVKLATPPPATPTPAPEPTPEPTAEPTPAPTEPPAAEPEEPVTEPAEGDAE